MTEQQKKETLLQTRHLVREVEPKKEDFEIIEDSFDYDDPVCTIDNEAYQKALSDFKERNPEEPDRFKYLTYEDDEQDHLYPEYYAKVKAYKASRLFYEGFEKIAKNRINDHYQGNGMTISFDGHGSIWISYNGDEENIIKMKKGISLYQWEAITGLTAIEL